VGRFIVSFEHEGARYYALWDTISDAPDCRAMRAREFRQHIIETQGTDRLPALLSVMMARAAKWGTPSRYRSLADALWLNRAGPDEACLTLPGCIAVMLGQPVLPEHVYFEDWDPDDPCNELAFSQWCHASGIDPNDEDA